MEEQTEQTKPWYKQIKSYIYGLLLSSVGLNFIQNSDDAKALFISIINEPTRSIQVDSIHCSRIDNLDTIKVSTVDLKHYFDDMKDHVSICIRESEYRQNQKIFQLQDNIQKHIKDITIINPYAVATVQDTQPATYQFTQK